jgi:translation elongation factor EF-G
MSEMLSYQNDLTSMTQGRASFSLEFSHCGFVPAVVGPTRWSVAVDSLWGH